MDKDDALEERVGVSIPGRNVEEVEWLLAGVGVSVPGRSVEEVE